MTDIARGDTHKAEWLIFQSRHEPGLQSMRDWLFARQRKINEIWPNMVGEELIRLQGEAKAVAAQIKLIDVEPSIKQR